MKQILSLSLFLFTITTIFGQSKAPMVSNVQFTVKDTSIQRNYITQMVTVTYDVMDPDNDTMTVYLRVSKDYGNNFSVKPLTVIGDIGPGITSGTRKTMTWIPEPTEQIDNARRYVYRVIADDMDTTSIYDVIKDISTISIYQKYFKKIYGNNHPFHMGHYTETRDFIKNQYTSNGYRLYTDQFVTNDRNHPELLKKGMNIVGNREGLLNDSTVLISAHYDNIDTTLGADDNNIAVACMLEAARVLKDYQFKNNIAMANWDMEEDGLVGATYYSLLPQTKKTKAVINFDGIGLYKEEANSQKVPTGFQALFPLAYAKVAIDSFRGNFIAIIGDVKSAALVRQSVLAADKYNTGLRYVDLTCPDPGCQVAKDLRRSDHAPFWDQNVPSVFFTATTEFRSDCYHKPCDTVINLAFAAKVIKTATAILLEQAGLMHAGYAQSSNPTSVQEQKLQDLHMDAPFPNPVTHHAYIKLNLPQSDQVHITAYDLQGKEVDQVFNGSLDAGGHTLLWQIKQDLPAGMYVVKAVSDKGLAQTYRVNVNLLKDEHQH